MQTETIIGNQNWYRFELLATGGEEDRVTLSDDGYLDSLDLKLYDADGNLLRESTKQENEKVVSLNELPPSIYYAVVDGIDEELLDEYNFKINIDRPFKVFNLNLEKNIFSETSFDEATKEESILATLSFENEGEFEVSDGENLYLFSEGTVSTQGEISVNDFTIEANSFIVLSEGIISDGGDITINAKDVSIEGSVASIGENLENGGIININAAKFQLTGNISNGNSSFFTLNPINKINTTDDSKIQTNQANTGNINSEAGGGTIFIGPISSSPIYSSLSISNIDRGIITKDSDGLITFKLTNTNISDRHISEIGIFKVDDLEGIMDGILPTAPEYINKALDRGKSLGNILFNSPEGFNQNLAQLININEIDRFGFYVVTDESNNPSENIFLSTNGSLKITGNDLENLNLSWKENKLDLDFKNELPLYPFAFPNGFPSLELDLRNEKNTVNGKFTIYREAEFDNLVGFYRLEDESGSVKDPLTGKLVKPDEVGYTEIALKNRVEGLNLQTQNQTTNVFEYQLSGGYLYAPFLIADSNTPNDNFDNIYLPFGIASPDKTEHIKIFGLNTFGFEDSFRGGDRDFNDLIVSFEFNT